MSELTSTTENRVCSSCGREYPIEYFGRTKQGRLHVRCVYCSTGRYRAYRAANPERCAICYTKDYQPLHGHHFDYTKPLEVVWLCAKCHMRLHRAMEDAHLAAEEMEKAS